MSHRCRLIDTAGSEIGIGEDAREQVGEEETIDLRDGSGGVVREVYDDEHGTEGGVVTTLVVERERAA